MFALSCWHLKKTFIYLTIQIIIFMQCNPVKITSNNDNEPELPPKSTFDPITVTTTTLISNHSKEYETSNVGTTASSSVLLKNNGNNDDVKNGNDSSVEKQPESNVITVSSAVEATTNSAEFYNNLANQLEKAFDNDPTTMAPRDFVRVVDVYPSFECDNKTEVFSDCANSCPASCEEPERKRCNTFCWKGCECAPGHVKNHRYQCIPKEQCPKCPANTHYRNCGPSCEPTCSTYQNLPVYCNQYNCKRGCFCNYGFVRDETNNGTCIPIDQCPNECGPNEYWDVNGEPCIRTADNPRPNCLFDQPKPSCVCDTGFKRNPITKKCQPITLTETKCDPHETYSKCGTDCGRKCFDEQKRIKCPTVCTRGCFCNDGYLRSYDGRCVSPENCSQESVYAVPMQIA